MQKAQLLADFKNLIGPAGKGSEVGDVGLTYWLNEAYMVVVSKIIEVMPDYFNKKVTASSIAGQDEYELPSDFEKMVMCSISYDGSTYVRALPLNNIGQATDLTGNTGNFDQGQPFYYLSGQQIGFLPGFSTTLSNNIKIWYSYVPIELTLDADVPAIPLRLQYQLKYMAYANYLDQNDEHSAAEKMRQRFDVNTTMLVTQLSDRVVDSPKTVEVSGGSDLYANQYI